MNETPSAQTTPDPTPSKWADPNTYAGIASTAAGVLAAVGVANADQTTLVVASVSGLAGGLIALWKLIRSFRGR